MSTHDFTIILADLSVIDDDGVERLYESGCDDGLPWSSAGVAAVSFNRDAETLEEAILSAIRDVQQAGYRVARIEKDDVTTVNKINEQLLSV